MIMCVCGGGGGAKGVNISAVAFGISNVHVIILFPGQGGRQPNTPLDSYSTKLKEEIDL